MEFYFSVTLRRLGTKAIALTGEPDPFFILNGRAIRNAPFGGKSSKFARFSKSPTRLLKITS